MRINFNTMKRRMYFYFLVKIQMLHLAYAFCRAIKLIRKQRSYVFLVRGSATHFFNGGICYGIQH